MDEISDETENVGGREKKESAIKTDEDSIREQIIQLYSSRGGYAGAVTRKLCEFEACLYEGASLEAVSKSLESLNEAYNRFENVHLKFTHLAAHHDKDRVERSETQFYEVTQNIQNARAQFESFAQKQSATKQITPKDSVSQTSRRSKTSSASSAFAKATAKRAMLEAKASFLKKQFEIESEQFKLEQNLKQIKMQAEIEAANVEEKVLSKYVSDKSYDGNVSSMKPSDSGIKQEFMSLPVPLPNMHQDFESKHKYGVNNPYGDPQPYTSGSNPSKAVNEHAQHSVNPNIGGASAAVNSHKGSESELKLQRQLLDVISLPKTSLMTFDGNPLDYWVFVNAFDSSVGQSTVGDGVKLNRLLEYCTGKAAQVVKPCIMMKETEGYSQARKLLKERFGNNYMISEAWVKKITDGAPIRPNNAQAFRDLADDVRACIGALSAMNMLEEIDSRCRMVKIVSRLPFYIQGRWRKEALKVVTNTGKYPNIVNFSAFLETVAREHFDPVFGFAAEQNDQKELTLKSKQQKRGGSSFTVQGSGIDKPKDGSKQNIDNARNAGLKCFVCNGNHQMINCKKFLGMSVEKRLDTAREHKLCFNCLEFRNHSAKMCRHRSKCDVENCKLKHSKLLHEAFISRKTNHHNSTGNDIQHGHGNKIEAHSNVCTRSETDFLKVSLPIVTIHVRGKGTNEFVRTNALLDPGSNKSFCSSELVKMLGLKGKNTILTLKTLNDGKETMVEEVFLEAMSTIGKRKHRKLVQLPKVYALEEFPALRGSIASATDISKWSHMKDIYVPQEQNVTILIGQDVPQGLLPLEIRRGNDGEPYAIRTALGWTVNGPLGEICETLDNVASSHFISGKPETHDSLQLQVERFWTLDTGQVLAGSVPQMSVEDKRVLNVWNGSIEHKEGHYELCIPFKENIPDLPNNKPLALKRLQSLSKRFVKDCNFKKRYTEEIHKLLELGYAETVPDCEGDLESGEEGKTWYLPHHAVVNPNKPDKLRVVFDCAAEYKGTSLNKKKCLKDPI